MKISNIAKLVPALLVVWAIAGRAQDSDSRNPKCQIPDPKCFLNGPDPKDAGRAFRLGPRARRMPWPLLAALAVMFTAAGVTAGMTLLSRAPEPPFFTRLTFQHGYISGARFAPDGRTVAYSASWKGDPSDVYSMRIETPDARPLGMPGSHLFAIYLTADAKAGVYSFQRTESSLKLMTGLR